MLPLLLILLFTFELVRSFSFSKVRLRGKQQRKRGTKLERAMGAAEKEQHSMKERGSDREKGSAKSCQPEIKQAGTLPIPKPLHPPQSHILPLHSLYLSLLLPSSISCHFLPFHRKKDIFNPVFNLFFLVVIPTYVPSYQHQSILLRAVLIPASLMASLSHLITRCGGA